MSDISKLGCKDREDKEEGRQLLPFFSDRAVGFVAMGVAFEVWLHWHLRNKRLRLFPSFRNQLNSKPSTVSVYL